MKTRQTSQRLAHDYTQTACGAAVSDRRKKVIRQKGGASSYLMI